MLFPLDTVGGGYFIYLQSNSKLKFTNNKIFLPAAAYNGSGGYFVSTLIQGAQLVSGNTYTTDLTSGVAFFATAYDGAYDISNERYLTPTHWKSAASSVWDDSTAPYAKTPVMTDGSGGPGVTGIWYAYAIKQFSVDTTGTVGNATANGGTGKSKLASGATTCTITNSAVKAGDTVQITPLDIDANITKWKTDVPADGSFVVTVNTAAAANWSFAWVVNKKGN